LRRLGSRSPSFGAPNRCSRITQSVKLAMLKFALGLDFGDALDAPHAYPDACNVATGSSDIALTGKVQHKLMAFSVVTEIVLVSGVITRK
jgi:hypothetical protein